MTRPEPETPAAETNPRSADSAAATGGDGSDSDTQRPTEPKGSGLGAEPYPGARPSNEGGGTDVGSGGGPKTGMGAEPKTGGPGAKGGSSS